MANIGDLVGPTEQRSLTTVSQVDPIYVQFPISEQRALEMLRRWELGRHGAAGRSSSS